MTLSEELQWRGFVNQTTLRDITDLDTRRFTFYWGVDPSADSMHIGQLAMAVMIRHFIRHGHAAMLLVGGATGQIGDPDGRTDERQLKSLEEVDKNKAGIAAQYRRLFGSDMTVVDNYEWFKGIGYLTFLRDVGKHFSMTQLLDRDFIKSRIGEGGAGISYAEFSYSLIQGYDFLHLHREYGVDLQIAGADQWGNSISGVDLIRKLEGHEAHVWTAPLVINKSTGRKFGKSEAGAVWLDEAKTSVYQFYQFWLNADDAGVIDYIKLYTDLGPDDVARLEESLQTNPAGREAQKLLAAAVTDLVHGHERRESVERVTAALFAGTSLNNLSDADLDMLAAEIPSVPRGVSIVQALVKAGMATSNGDARRLVEGGAISVNGQKVMAADTSLDSLSLIKKGKNAFLLVR